MDADRRIGRAAFLGMVAAGVGGIFVGDTVANFLTKGLPSGVRSALPFGNGWRIYTISGHMPTFDPAHWSLQVVGEVKRPMTLDYEQLKALPATAEVRDFHCVTGWSVSGVHWRGVRLSDLLDRVQPTVNAQTVRFISAEVPYVDTLTIDQARMSDVLLAYEMDGKPLPREHGAPLRLIVPEMYGYKSVKWLQRIELVTESPPGYWEQNGYDTDAWVGRSNGY